MAALLGRLRSSLGESAPVMWEVHEAESDQEDSFSVESKEVSVSSSSSAAVVSGGEKSSDLQLIDSDILPPGEKKLMNKFEICIY